jgi:hypothetical protein
MGTPPHGGSYLRMWFGGGRPGRGNSGPVTRETARTTALNGTVPRSRGAKGVEDHGNETVCGESTV